MWPCLLLRDIFIPTKQINIPHAFDALCLWIFLQKYRETSIKYNIVSISWISIWQQVKEVCYVKNFGAIICFCFLVNVYWSKTDRSVTADKAARLAQTEPVILP